MRSIFVILFSIFSLLLVCPCHAQSAKRVKIGFITDLTGSFASWGTQSQIGAKLAAKELAEKEWPVEILFGDHQSKNTTATSEAQKMVTLDDLDALFVEFSPQAIATAGIAGQSRKLFLATTGATSFLDLNPYAFKTFVDYRKGCREIAAFWQKMHYAKVGMLKPETEYGELCERGAREVYPGINVQAFKLNDDVATQLLNLKQDKVEAIFNVGLESDVLTTYRRLSEMRWTVPLGLFEADGFTKNVITTYREMLEGTSVFGISHVKDDFERKVMAFDPTGGKNLEATALAYLHVKQLVNAVRSCKPRDVVCQSAALARSRPDPLLGFVKFENRIASYESYVEVWGSGSLSLFKSYE
jgi:ABC-type branched-subunit amino acid transport system substrate-binding protein